MGEKKKKQSDRIPIEVLRANRDRNRKAMLAWMRRDKKSARKQSD